MSEKRPLLSEYRAMWLFAMFDLPVGTREQRKAYAQFRKRLLASGFTMLQYSVYARYCPSEEAAEAYRNRIRLNVPDEGQVRVLHVTDRQFGKMECYFWAKRKPAEEPPAQLMLF